MTLQRSQQLVERRESLAEQIALLKALPEGDRPSKPSELKAWFRDLTQLEYLLNQLDLLIMRSQPRFRAEANPSGGEPEAAADDGAVVLARIPKGKRAEMRVAVKPWKSRSVIDIRIWSMIQGSAEMRPSRKGITFDASKLDDLLSALQQAKQHV